MVVSEYISENWILILVLLGFVISLISTVFMEQKTIRRLFALIIEIFVLSVIVFAEFKMAGKIEYSDLRIVLMALRYSATPLIIAQIIITIVKNQKWYIFIPAIIFAIINIISIFTGIVFSLDAQNKLQRGPLGMLPFIGAGLYCVLMVYLMVTRGAKQRTDIVPVIFFAFAFASGLILPFTIGSDYAQVFCPTIAVSMFVYYVFTILQLTKRDALTGLLNRQAYYADTRNEIENITAIVSVDMNGLKAINDNEGHVAGDKALATISDCFIRAAKSKHRVYRVGGDEFVIVCRRSSEKDVSDLCERIQKEVSATQYTCSVGYCYAGTGPKSIDDILKASDENMYSAKEKFYHEKGIERR